MHLGVAVKVVRLECFLLALQGWGYQSIYL